MKNILILSDEDVVELKLVTLYHDLYESTRKELILCRLQLSNCRNASNNLGYKRPKTRFNTNLQNPLNQYILRTKPSKTCILENRQEIIQLIRNESIDIVLLPIYSDDQDRAFQLNAIIKDIKRVSRVDIIGIYV